MTTRRATFALPALVLGLATAPAWGNATITILNADGANEGFNDPTPAAPVGGNPRSSFRGSRRPVRPVSDR